MIETWLKKLEKYKVSHKDGFYIILTLFNSPEILVDGIHRMPFSKFDPTTNSHHTSLFFMKINTYYHKLEEDCWLLLSDFQFKANTAIKIIYAEKSPKEYYFINFFTCKNDEAPSIKKQGQ